MIEKTLTEVIDETTKNSQFLEDILSDADKALAGKGWTMNADERRKLDDLLNNPQICDPATVLRAFNNAAKGNSAWDPPPWSPYYPGEEEMK
jgi:hypothetical protein